MKYNIDGKYPMMANWLLVDKMDDGTYYVNNVLNGEMFEVGCDTYRFLYNLNGNRNPHKVARKFGVDADELMDYFAEHKLIRTDRRTLFAGEDAILYTVYIPAKYNTKSIIPKIYNCLLYTGFVPMLLFGLYKLMFTSCELNTDYIILGTILGTVIGMVMHEISHAMACLAYGGNFFEAGVMWEKFYPGAYVAIDNFNVESKLKRVQIDAAGAEMNLMFTGIFVVLCTLIERINGLFFAAALTNGMLAVFNFMFIDGFDGCSIIGELIGLSGGVDSAKKILKKELKCNVRKFSANKKVVVLACAIIIAYQILLPIAFINNILLIIGGSL